MKQSYQEREVSKVNKRISIVGKDISIDGNNGSKTAARNELDYDSMKSANSIGLQSAKFAYYSLQSLSLPSVNTSAITKT